MLALEVIDFNTGGKLFLIISHTLMNNNTPSTVLITTKYFSSSHHDIAYPMSVIAQR